MPLPLKIKVPAALATALLVSACTTSPTEADFGNSVRSFVSHQQMQPSGTLRADEPIETTDGRRLENVTTVYQSYVGDPIPVARDVKVEAGGK